METEGVIPTGVNNSTPDKRMSESIDLYSFPPSPPCRAVLLLAKAIGLKLNVKTVNVMAGETRTPEFIKLNPQHTIPTLDDNGFVLWESRAIMEYLTQQYGDGKYFSNDPKEAARINQFLYFDAATLMPRLVDYFIPVLTTGAKPDPEKATKVEHALDILNTCLKGHTWITGQSILWSWYNRTKKAMTDFDYEELNQ
ncbi:glutathione S-transferase, partial [Rhyzopertha dominica]